MRGFKGAEERGITFHPVLVREYAREQAEFDRLRHQVEDGQVTLRVARTFLAERAAEAHCILRRAAPGTGWSWSSERAGQAAAAPAHRTSPNGVLTA